MIKDNSRRFPTSSIGNILLEGGSGASDYSDIMDPDQLRKRIDTRLKEVGLGRVSVSLQIGRGRDYLSNFLNGEKESLKGEVFPKLAELLQCRIEYLLDDGVEEPVPAGASDEIVVPIRGYVGANPDGRILFAMGDDLNEAAIVQPGGTPRSIAIKVAGHSMRDIADEGSLIFYEEVRTPPSEDMLGHVVVVETALNEVLIKRLLRGSRKGVYDLESNSAEPRRDVKLNWAAHILSIVPPYRARQIIKRLAA